MKKKKYFSDDYIKNKRIRTPSDEMILPVSKNYKSVKSKIKRIK